MKSHISIVVLILIVFFISINVPAQTNRTPKQVFNGLRSAYEKRDRKDALKYATPKVVRNLFSPGRIGLDITPWDYSACEKDKNGYHCFLEYTASGLNIWIRKVKGKYYVTRVWAIAD